MFRTQTNAFDDVVAKATDENLTSENWEYMMDAWEKVNSSGDTGPKDAVAALIKRLAHRNANVQLYTLELANAFTQNCGPKMHQEMASRAFTDALLRLASDRTTHQAVKSSVLEKMAEWSHMFARDPGLGIMEQAFNRLKSQNPNLHPPSKPTKREITDIDRQKEEEELQMALAISLKDKTVATAAAAPGRAQGPQASSTGMPQVQAEPQPQAPHTTAATVSRVRALYDFVPSESGELAFRKGDIIAVLESVYKDWWKGSLRGQTGIFPLNYVEKLSDPTVEELQKDAQMESEVFGQTKNVEKLLALLSTSEGNSSVQDNEEITTLYHSTLAIRPKLIELIGKYSQKKDDFVALNEKFIKARRDYESLLESSMSQTAAQHYGRPPTTSTPYAYPPTPAAEPSRYYTPGPVSVTAAASPPPQQQQQQQQKPGYGGHSPSTPYFEPQHPGEPPAPFYVVGNTAPGGSRPNDYPPAPTSSARPNEYPPANTNNSRPPQHDYPPHTHHHDPSAPQELATSIYDTPTEPSYPKPYTAYQRPVSNAYPDAPTHTPVSPNPAYQRQSYPQQPNADAQNYYRHSELFLPQSGGGGRA